MNVQFYLFRVLDTLSPLQQADYKFMVLGMPNVGKSTLINALRTIGIGRGESAAGFGLVRLCLMIIGNAVRTGKKPGITRSVSNLVRICEEPSILLYDTPGTDSALIACVWLRLRLLGVMVPRVDDGEVGLKLALVGKTGCLSTTPDNLINFSTRNASRRCCSIRRVGRLFAIYVE